MKTFAHSLLTALLLSTATFASTAATTPTAANPTVTTSSYKVAVFPSATPSRLNVFVERTPGQSMVVSLKSTEGKVLGKQLISKKQGNFRFQFDMSELQDGTYTVELSSGNDVTVYPVTLASQPIQVSTRTISIN
ncbi:hypothetical protein [Spirosoma sp. KNUC1025]|uniref:hypothetical protein n=1 Tax=Spirosoma sp. KNUC1025 TaxID=2894082 RepID=UPI00386B34A8|nr:hypothetical protein LN737_06030 [Spirosoma sp. KNUC1025]